MYYEDEYEDYACDCGALFDAFGWCPYCDFVPGQYFSEAWADYFLTEWLIEGSEGDENNEPL